LAAGGRVLTIVDALTVDGELIVRSLFKEYADSLGIDLCFQDFQEELATLPGSYAPPDGRLLLAFHNDQPAGCVALRPLEPGICEMKRLYVRPAFRSLGVGKLLAEQVISEARTVGYRRMRLDSLPSMTAALGLYRRLGFREMPPYRANPIEGAVFLELELIESTNDA
jgi:ribosomal protein S18 acetylase RimI-like enzyme